MLINCLIGGILPESLSGLENSLISVDHKGIFFKIVYRTFINLVESAMRIGEYTTENFLKSLLKKDERKLAHQKTLGEGS